MRRDNLGTTAHPYYKLCLTAERHSAEGQTRTRAARATPPRTTARPKQRVLALLQDAEGAAGCRRPGPECTLCFGVTAGRASRHEARVEDSIAGLLARIRVDDHISTVRMTARRPLLDGANVPCVRPIDARLLKELKALATKMEARRRLVKLRIHFRVLLLERERERAWADQCEVARPA